MKTKRIVLDVSPEDHAKVKIQAIKRNISMRTWVLRAINQALKQEEKFE
jgi:predicted HicB family RNase H-like nuclease